MAEPLLPEEIAEAAAVFRQVEIDHAEPATRRQHCASVGDYFSPVGNHGQRIGDKNTINRLPGSPTARIRLNNARLRKRRRPLSRDGQQGRAEVDQVNMGDLLHSLAEQIQATASATAQLDDAGAGGNGELGEHFFPTVQQTGAKGIVPAACGA